MLFICNLRRLIYGLFCIFTLLPSAHANVIKEQLNHADAIIVGAGVSGLAAAQELNRQGYKIIVLEASNRIGGRIWTTQQWGTTTELGASWMHMTDDNPVATLIKNEKIKTFTTQYRLTEPYNKFSSISIFYDEGTKMSIAEKKHTIKSIQNFNDYLRNNSTRLEYRSFSNALNDYFYHTHINLHEQTLLSKFTEDIITFDNGADLKDFSYLAEENPLSPEPGGKDLIFHHGGYAQLIAMLVKNIPIYLNQKVKKIDYSENEIIIKTQDSTYIAPKVIVTVPLGILKEKNIQFKPPLPQEKLKAINDIGFGIYNKNYLLFGTPFWDKESEWLVLLPANNTSKEYYEILNYYRYSKQPLLLAFTAGDFAKEVEDWPDSKIVRHIMEKLRKVYGPDIPDPVSYKITRWGKNPYTHGSYSYPKVGGKGKIDRAILAAPINNRLFFAGEATSDIYGTVHGAYTSGIETAKKIRELDRINKNRNYSVKEFIKNEEKEKNVTKTKIKKV